MNIVSEPGTYFRDVYADLLKRVPGFPASDPNPNLPECISAANFVRAEMLARQHKLPSDVITHLREMAVLQCIIDYRNFDGLKRLVEEFELAPAEVRRILGLIEAENTYPCFSFSKKTELAVDENWAGVWQKDYYPLVQQVIGKPSVLARFIAWIKTLLLRR